SAAAAARASPHPPGKPDRTLRGSVRIGSSSRQRARQLRAPPVRRPRATPRAAPRATHSLPLRPRRPRCAAGIGGDRAVAGQRGIMESFSFEGCVVASCSGGTTCIEMHQNVALPLTHSSLKVLRSLLAKLGQVNLRRVGRTGGLTVKEHLAMREGVPHSEAEQVADAWVGADMTDRERGRVALDAVGASAPTRAPWRWLYSNWCAGSLVGATALGL